MMPLATVPIPPPLLGELVAITEVGGPLREVGQARAGGMAMFTTGIAAPFRIDEFDYAEVASVVTHVLKEDARQRSYFVSTYDLFNGTCLVTLRSYLFAEQVEVIGRNEARALVSAWVRMFASHAGKDGDD